VYKALCEYKILCESAAVDIRPFPACSDVTWGAGKVVDQYGLVPTHRTALLAAPNGNAEISFVKLRPVQLHANLVCEGVPDTALEKCVSISELDDQVWCVGYRSGPASYGPSWGESKALPSTSHQLTLKKHGHG